MSAPASLLEELAGAAASGKVLDLHARPVEETRLPFEHMLNWDDSHNVTAAEIVSVLEGAEHQVGLPTPRRALRIRGARIVGTLDLDYLNSSIPLELEDCLMEEGISARWATIAGLSLRRCQVRGKDDSPISFIGIRVSGDLSLASSEVCSTSDGRWVLDFTGARVEGNINLRAAKVLHSSGPGVGLERCQVSGTVDLGLNSSIEAESHLGAIRAAAAVIDTQFSGSGSTVKNKNGPAIVLDRAKVGVLFMHDMKVAACCKSGAITLIGARVLGELSCFNAQIENASGPALTLDAAVLDSGVFLDGGFTAKGTGLGGTVRMVSARVSGQVGLRGAQLRNSKGPVLMADRATIGSGLYLDAGFAADGGGCHLPGARIAGGVVFRDCSVVARDDSVVTLDSCQIEGDLLFVGKTSFQASGRAAAIRMPGARVQGVVHFDRNVKVSNSVGPVLNLDNVYVSDSLQLGGVFQAGDDADQPAIVLSRSRLGSLSACGDVRSAEPSWRWEFGDCMYRSVPTPDNRTFWLTLLRDGTQQYSAQSYRQLASVYREAGHDKDVRQILIAQRRDQLRRGRLGFFERLSGRTTGLLLGFGWKPWRALYGLAAVFAVSVLLTVLLGSHGALVRSQQSASSPAPPCSVVERIGVGLDLGTPLISSSTKARDRCMLSPDAGSATMSVLLVATWVLQLSAWSFAALFVAGFTGIVRKT